MTGEPAWFADRSMQRTVTVQENLAIARETYRIRIACPEMARQVTPGQFLMLRLRSGDDPLLGRPFALYDTVLDQDDRPEAIDLVYQVVGRVTRRLAALSVGDSLEVWGPLGNGFPPQDCQQLVMVAGGIGQTPFLALAREHLHRRVYGDPPRRVPHVPAVVLCYGARSGSDLAGVEDFERLGVDVRIRTDDGSAGERGLVTDALQQLLEEPAKGTRRIVCCGPEVMMSAVADLARRFDVPAQVSLETPMACGIGICFTCVAPLRDSSGRSDYHRTCVEGPVFDATRVDWARLDEDRRSRARLGGACELSRSSPVSPA